MSSHTDDKKQGAASLTANARASGFRELRRDKGCLRGVAAVLALLFVVPALAQDASPFRDLDRYGFGYAYPGSQLKDHIYEGLAEIGEGDCVFLYTGHGDSGRTAPGSR